MRRLPVPFPLSFCLFAAAHPFGAGWAVFGPVGFWDVPATAQDALFSFPAVEQGGAQAFVQRQHSRPKPAADQRIGNALRADTFLPIVQQKAVSIVVVAALAGEFSDTSGLSGYESRQYIRRVFRICNFTFHQLPPL